MGKEATAGDWPPGLSPPAPTRSQSLPSALHPPPPPRAPPSPDLERKPGGGAWERPVREDEFSPLEAAVRGPRPEPRPGAQEATHALREAHRLRPSGQEKHPRRRHNAALGSLRPTPRPLVAQRASPRSLPPGGKEARLPGLPPGNLGKTLGDEPGV